MLSTWSMELRLTDPVVGRQKGGLVSSLSSAAAWQSCSGLAKAWLARQAQFPNECSRFTHWVGCIQQGTIAISKINQMAKTHKPNSEWLSVKDLECPFIKTVGSFCLPVPTLNLLHFLFHSANATLHTLKYEMEEKLKLESLDTGHCQAVVITAKPGNAARRCRFKFTTWRCCTKNKEDKVGVNRSGCPGHKQASDDTCPPHFIWHSSNSHRGE